MENKTLQDFKNEVASTFRNFDGSKCNWDDFKCKASSYLQLQYLEMAAVRYASHVAEQVCRKQKQFCAESAQMSFLDGHSKERKQLKYFQSGADNLTIDKDSVLYAPLAITQP